MNSDPSESRDAPARLVIDQPLVSVAIVTYNQCAFLEECIESVLDQDYRNIEIVVADDGSTDGTVDLLHRYDTEHPGRFRLVLSDHNRGITPNSNAAHFACAGKYIAWIGGDDLMLPGKISKQVAFMEGNPGCSICYHDLDVFESESNRTIRLRSQGQRPRCGDIRTAIRYSTFNGACSTMVRRSDTPPHGFDPRLPVASDWLYWIETLAGGGRIEYIDAVLGRYRRHAGNVTRRVNSGFNQAGLDHFTSCHIALSKFPEYARDVQGVYADLLFQHRRLVGFESLGWLSLRAHFRLDRLFTLLRERARKLLRRHSDAQSTDGS